MDSNEHSHCEDSHDDFGLVNNSKDSAAKISTDKLPDGQKPNKTPTSSKTAADNSSVKSKLPTTNSKNIDEQGVKLPRTFVVKYLGKRDARGLWGIKNTRKPVDDMVAASRANQSETPLPFIQLEVSLDGVTISAMPQNKNPNFDKGTYPIDSISYGVQDLVYTRIFAMIVVHDTKDVFRNHPFECHAYVCDKHRSARELTMALAAAFRAFSETAKKKGFKKNPKKFAIDLRKSEELQAEIDEAKDDDSEV
ncbi:low density lipoprotein receptor adapter protein 1-like [Limulus polyphemus]|uniref:Low density lipoprotein receptor adapter protein 1-like n=1 Tax=Limulus polyphemus TaxID=6850 RepID=A0ABM1T8G7_LIMPO|nr:low density lipoprotein receptor adapter protein 1-like [Limulus polyphemus]